MKRWMALFLTLLAGSLLACATGARKKAETSGEGAHLRWGDFELSYFEEATPGADFQPRYYRIEDPAGDLYITWGENAAYIRDPETWRVITLPLESAAQVGAVSIGFYRGDYLVAYNYEYNGEPGGEMVRVDGSGLRVRWRWRSDAPALGEPVIAGDVTYVAGRNLAAKIDLMHGLPVWTHRDFGAVGCVPEGEPRYDNAVVSFGYRCGDAGRDFALQVDDRTGDIMLQRP